MFDSNRPDGVKYLESTGEPGTKAGAPTIKTGPLTWARSEGLRRIGCSLELKA
jgi:hypothetical protein